jgi:hypothetical protein
VSGRDLRQALARGGARKVRAFEAKVAQRVAATPEHPELLRGESDALQLERSKARAEGAVPPRRRFEPALGLDGVRPEGESLDARRRAQHRPLLPGREPSQGEVARPLQGRPIGHHRRGSRVKACRRGPTGRAPAPPPAPRWPPYGPTVARPPNAPAPPAPRPGPRRTGTSPATRRWPPSRGRWRPRAAAWRARSRGASPPRRAAGRSSPRARVRAARVVAPRSRRAPRRPTHRRGRAPGCPA